MKEHIDIVSAIAGGLAAFLKALKRRLSLRLVVISAIVGAFFGFGAIGVLSFFLKDVSTNLVVLTSFASGWVASEFTDVFEEAVKDGYDIAKAYAKTRTKDRKGNSNKTDKDEK